MATTPIPMPQQQQGADPASMAEYIRAMAAQQANTTGLTTMQPNTGGATPPTQGQRQQPGQQQNQAFGAGQGGAKKVQSMQNLVKAAQAGANQFAQYAEQKQQREYQTVITRFTGATQGLAQAQAQVMQATDALKKNPQDSQAQQQLQQAQAALKTNQTVLNDMANDKKATKVITKAFGIDDKNADSPERKAALSAMKQTTGLGDKAAGMQSSIPQTQQLSPQAQAQSQARSAGVTGAPATQGQVLSAYGKLYSEGLKQGLTKEKLDIEMNKRGLTVKKDDDGNDLYNEDGSPQLRPMTEEEVKQNPITKSQLDYKAAQTAAQNAAAAAKTDPNNPDLQIKASDAAARMLSARAAMLRAQKYVPGASGGGGSQQTDTKELAKELIAGKIAPSELPGFGKVRAQVFAEAQRQDPKFNPAVADIQYKYSQNQAVQSTLANINSLAGYGSEKGSMDELLAQSGRVKRSKFPPVNSVEMASIIAGGDKEAAAYGAVALDVSDQIAKILQGGGTGNASSDMKLRQAQAAMNLSFSPGQLATTIRETKVLLGNRQQAMLARGGPFLKAQQEQINEGDSSATGDDPAGLFNK